MNGPRRNVLILGGGDGLAAREVLKYDDVATVTLVDLDPAVTGLATHDPRLRSLNRSALHDPRVQVINADGFRWLRDNMDGGTLFDVIIADFPDPDSVDLAKLYSLENWTMASRLLEPDGRLVVQAGSQYFATNAYWCTVETVRAAGLSTTAYHVDVPSFGDWGFVIATKNGVPSVALAAGAPRDLRFVSPETLTASTVFANDVGPRPVRVSTLLSPTIVDYQRSGWRQG